MIIIAILTCSIIITNTKIVWSRNIRRWRKNVIQQEEIAILILAFSSKIILVRGVL